MMEVLTDNVAKVHIDREDCIVCGQCWETCPAYFESDDDDDFSRIKEEYRIDGSLADGNVPANLKNCVVEAADGCPVEIIHVE